MDSKKENQESVYLNILRVGSLYVFFCPNEEKEDYFYVYFINFPNGLKEPGMLLAFNVEKNAELPVYVNTNPTCYTEYTTTIEASMKLQTSDNDGTCTLDFDSGKLSIQDSNGSTETLNFRLQYTIPLDKALFIEKEAMTTLIRFPSGVDCSDNDNDNLAIGVNPVSCSDTAASETEAIGYGFSLGFNIFPDTEDKNRAVFTVNRPEQKEQGFQGNHYFDANVALGENHDFYVSGKDMLNLEEGSKIEYNLNENGQKTGTFDVRLNIHEHTGKGRLLLSVFPIN